MRAAVAAVKANYSEVGNFVTKGFEETLPWPRLKGSRKPYQTTAEECASEQSPQPCAPLERELSVEIRKAPERDPDSHLGQKVQGW